MRPDTGERVHVIVNVSNEGDTAGSHEVTVRTDGRAIASRTVHVPGCGEVSTTFYHTFEQPGNQSLSVNGWDFQDFAVQERTTTPEPDGLSVDPARLGFEEVAVGETATRTVTVTNRGETDLQGVRPLLPGGEAGTQYEALGAEAASLAPGESRDVAVRFAPRETGWQEGRLVFRNGSGADLASVPLGGRGTGPDVEVSPSSLGFANATVGERSTGTVTVLNAGTESVTVDGLRLLGGTGDFAVETDAGFTLEAGGTRDVTVSVEPTSPGPQSATLQIAAGSDRVADEVVWLSTTRARASLDLGRSATRSWLDVSVTNATAGESLSVSIPTREEAEGASLQALSVTPGTDGNFSLTATDSDDPLPSSPTFGLGDGTAPLDYLSVDHSIANAAVERANLTVRVSRDRLEALGTRPEAVSLYRYVEGSGWEVQPTSVRERTPTHVVVQATAEGLSEWTAAARRPRFNITEKSTSLDSGVVGDEVTIQVFVRNTGGADGVYVAELLLNGEVVDEREATIPEGGKRALNFERSFDRAGDYRVRVNDVFVGTVTISAQEQSVDVEGDGAADGGGSGDADGAAGTTEQGVDDAASLGGSGDAEGGLPLLPLGVVLGGAALAIAYVAYSRRQPPRR
jgi:hypothetical protein